MRKLVLITLAALSLTACAEQPKQYGKLTYTMPDRAPVVAPTPVVADKPYPGTAQQKDKFFADCFETVRHQLRAPLEAKVLSQKLGKSSGGTCLQTRNGFGCFNKTFAMCQYDEKGNLDRTFDNRVMKDYGICDKPLTD